MNARVYCGTSGFAYSTWKPGFYPEKLAAKKFLSHYASRLNAVESNYTFRSLPSENTLANWIADTPDSFLFAVKGHQSVTHFKKSPIADSTRGFFDAIEPLRAANRLGPVLFQFPPSRQADPETLQAVLDNASPGARLAFEFRHASWFSDSVYDILRKHRAALCLAESEKLETPPVITADFVYFRLRKPTYTPAEISEFAAKALQLSDEGREVFVFFMHQDEPTGPAYAETLLREVNR